MSAPTHIATATTVQVGSTASSIVANLPAVQADDVTLLSVVRYGTSVNVNTPAGWTLLASTNFRTEASGYTQLHVFYKVAAASAAASTVTVSGTSLSYWGVSAAVYRGVNTATPIAASAAADGKTTGHATAPAIASVNNARRVSVTGYRTDQYWGAAPAGWSLRSNNNGGIAHWEAATFTAAQQDFDYSISGNFLNWHAVSVALAGLNSAPNAPTLTGPANAATIDAGITQRFSWTFSDPDAGDSQSKYDLRYRLVGAPTWTNLTATTTTNFWDAPASTFAAGDYEWQVRTYDAQGAQGAWMASSFFTAATAPPAPTITAPVSGATISNTETVTWSAPNQAAYQLRRVADAAGAPDTGTVYYDSGEVVTTSDRARTVAFDTNDRYEHIQVRVRDGLWSSWASIRVQVSYTPPETPVVTLAPDASTGLLLVSIANPAPGAGVPATSYNDVYIDDGDGEERKATMLAPNTAWTYWTPRSGRDYDGAVRVVAVGNNGTTASS